MQPIIDIPILFPNFLSIILLLVSAFAIEVHYIGRVGIASNVFFSWQLLAPFWVLLPSLAQGWLNLGLFVGFFALGSRLFKKSLPSEFYTLAKYFFGAVSILVIIVYLYTSGIKLF